MSAFLDSAFLASGFLTDGGAPPVDEPVLIGTGVASFGIAISVVSPLIFAAGQHSISWYVTVVIGGVDVSARLSGAIRISAAEDSARVASLSVIPASAAELEAYEGQAATIDVTLFRTGQTGTWRRFTGVIEGVEYDAAAQLATLTLRDGYQERVKACASAAEVEALFDGGAWPSPALLPWSDSTPDPSAYFAGLLDTYAGSAQIDSSGIWRARPWSIGAPLATLRIYDGSLRVTRPRRADLPTAIHATLTHRFPRLHAAAIDLTWEAVPRVRYVVDGLPTMPKSMVQQALAGLSGWYVKGTPTIVQPIPGSYPVPVGPATVYYLISYEMAQVTAQSFTATVYRRWYQDVEVVYSLTIPLGGTSERDDSITGAIASTFDASAWETAPNANNDSDLYLANAPTSPTTLTGYEGLPEPWPPINSAMDQYSDISEADLAAACRHVAARAVRRAAAGQRQARVSVQTPFDPRWEIGDVLAVDDYGVTATGQLIEIEDTLDHDTGDIVSAMTLTCPAGGAADTAFSLTPTIPTPTVTHALAAPPLLNHVGAHFDTPDVPDEDQLAGFLCNTVPTSDNYDATAPVFNTQLRIIMPEIPAEIRDPITIEQPMTASVTLAGSGITVSI